MTPWPRLETGKISVAPCNKANQKACQMLKTRVLSRKVYEAFGSTYHAIAVVFGAVREGYGP